MNNLSSNGNAADFLEHVAATRVWDGSAIPPGACERLTHDWAQLQGIEEQMAAVKAARARLRVDPATTTGRAVLALQQVRAIRAGGAWVVATGTAERTKTSIAPRRPMIC